MIVGSVTLCFLRDGFVVLRDDLVAEFEPDKDDGEGFETVGLHVFLADETGHEVGMGHGAADEHIDHQRHIPLGTLPGGCGVPDGDAYDGDDVGAVLRTCGEEHRKHQDGGQQSLAEGVVGVLPEPQIGGCKGDESGDDQPQVGIGGTA